MTICGNASPFQGQASTIKSCLGKTAGPEPHTHPLAAGFLALCTRESCSTLTSQLYTGCSAQASWCPRRQESQSRGVARAGGALVEAVLLTNTSALHPAGEDRTLFHWDLCLKLGSKSWALGLTSSIRARTSAMAGMSWTSRCSQRVSPFSVSSLYVEAPVGHEVAVARNLGIGGRRFCGGKEEEEVQG